MTCERGNEPDVNFALSEPILLYVHVPFCRRKCGYCSFYSGPWSDDAGAAYLEAACRELAQWGQRLDRPRVATVYMGGGTPSLLPGKAFLRFRQELDRWFQLEKDLEWTVEGNPESADSPSFFRQLRQAGVNRFSLGVQSFDDHDLNLLGRLHTADQAVHSFEMAREAGFDNIGLDLIWGLPDQTVAGWFRNLERAVDLGPSHMSCYGLSVDSGTRLEQAVHDESLVLPEEEKLEEMFLGGSAFLQEQGYLHYEISNFCRPDRESRHNGGYWSGRPYLGIGPAAVSCLNGKRWRNPEKPGRYAESAAAGPQPADMETLSRQDRINEAVILALRTAKGVDDDVFCRIAGHSFTEGREVLLGEFLREGLMRRTSSGWALTSRGMLVSNAVLAELLE